MSDTLVDGFALLEAMPSMARGRTELTPPVRIQPMAEHLVVYRVDGDSLLTVRTLGGRQSWRPILEGIDG